MNHKCSRKWKEGEKVGEDDDDGETEEDDGKVDDYDSDKGHNEECGRTRSNRRSREIPRKTRIRECNNTSPTM